MTVTFAPGSTAPLESVTVPVIALDFTCANSGLLKVASAISNASRTCNPNLPRLNSPMAVPNFLLHISTSIRDPLLLKRPQPVLQVGQCFLKTVSIQTIWATVYRPHSICPRPNQFRNVIRIDL